ncbi:hypothetical protein [Clostridium hydrogenum]|uniref:hypothetical protein n=1 Tax=Clostridium hydrogenum TaxID=2855764 RepID=UPI001F2E5E64|nr:hypothetical protein [Clostridium hydrogenum]
MSWKLEVYRAFFLAFGVFQVIANLNYLLLKDGIKLARKQHQEIPSTVTDKQMKIKVTLMFSFGIVFLSNGVVSFATHSLNQTYYVITLILFAVYASVEALYYKYWRTFGFSIISILLLIGFIML